MSANLVAALREQLSNGTANDLAQWVIDNQEAVFAALQGRAPFAAGDLVRLTKQDLWPGIPPGTTATVTKCDHAVVGLDLGPKWGDGFETSVRNVERKYPRVDIYASGDWYVAEGHGGFYRALGPSRETPEDALEAARERRSGPGADMLPMTAAAADMRARLQRNWPPGTTIRITDGIKNGARAIVAGWDDENPWLMRVTIGGVPRVVRFDWAEADDEGKSAGVLPLDEPRTVSGHGAPQREESNPASPAGENASTVDVAAGWASWTTDSFAESILEKHGETISDAVYDETESLLTDIARANERHHSVRDAQDANFRAQVVSLNAELDHARRRVSNQRKEIQRLIGALSDARRKDDRPSEYRKRERLPTVEEQDATHTCSWGLGANVLDFACSGCRVALHTGGFDGLLEDRLEWARRSVRDTFDAQVRAEVLGAIEAHDAVLRFAADEKTRWSSIRGAWEGALNIRLDRLRDLLVERRAPSDVAETRRRRERTEWP